MYKSLTVIIPVYNEKDTVKECIERVLKADTCGLNLNIIVSDNNSTDGTKEILKSINDEKVKCYFKEKNEGKGSNIKNALQYATGDLILFQDADLEYHPENFPDLINPFIRNNADVVFGSRLTGSKITKILGWPNLVGNKTFTLLANILFNKIFTDIATGYKVFTNKVIKTMDIRSDGFEIEPEITAKICKDNKIVIFEEPITIVSRGYEEGKKVRWWHFFTYVYHLIKWRFVN